MSVKWEIKVSLLWIICAVAVTAILLFKPFSCDSERSHFDWSQTHTQLDSLNYTQADPVYDPILPDTVPIPDEIVTSTTSGSGSWIPTQTYTPADTVAVELSEITLIDGSHWIKLLIGGSEVIWREIQHYQAPAPERNWQAHVEVCNCDSSRIGAGVGYNLLTVASVDVVPTVSVAVNADWIAPEIRLSHTVWSGVAVGAGAGYRFGADEGLHLSAGLSIEL